MGDHDSDGTREEEDREDDSKRSRMRGVRVGAPKQKWTPEEESALRAGVEKYGPGKWRAIQRDATFGPTLISRSNVDLKDKWRNLSTSGQTNSRGPKTVVKRGRRLLKGKLEDDEDEDDEDEEFEDDGALMLLTSSVGDDLIDATPLAVGGEAGILAQRKPLGAKYDDLVLEAISALDDPDGSSVADVASYIEDQQQRVPPKFHKLLALKLKTMSSQGKLTKVGKCYKIKEKDFSFDGKLMKGPRFRRQDTADGRYSPRYFGDYAKKMKGAAPLSTDIDHFKLKTAEEAAKAAAQAVADAEAAAAAAEQAAREAEAAEAEAEAAEAAAEAATLAAKSANKSLKTAAPVVREAVAVMT